MTLSCYIKFRSSMESIWLISQYPQQVILKQSESQISFKKDSFLEKLPNIMSMYIGKCLDNSYIIMWKKMHNYQETLNH